MLRPARVGTLAQVALRPSALQIVQKDVSRARAEVGLPEGGHGPTAPQLPAHDLSFIQEALWGSSSKPGSRLSAVGNAEAGLQPEGQVLEATAWGWIPALVAQW